MARSFAGEERQKIRFRRHHVVKPLDHLIQQRRRHELQGVPEQYAIEGSARVVEVLAQEVIDAADVGLFGRVDTKGFIQTANQILRIDLVAEIDSTSMFSWFAAAQSSIDSPTTSRILKKNCSSPRLWRGTGGSFLPALRICNPVAADRTPPAAWAASCDP